MITVAILEYKQNISFSSIEILRRFLIFTDLSFYIPNMNHIIIFKFLLYISDFMDLSYSYSWIFIIFKFIIFMDLSYSRIHHVHGFIIFTDLSYSQIYHFIFIILVMFIVFKFYYVYLIHIIFACNILNIITNPNCKVCVYRK